MPVLKNAKHERFAQARVKGETIDEAYVKAGYSANRGNAARLNAKESVQARIAELQGKAEAKVVVTVESLARELEEARSIAIKEKQSSAAVSASMGKAKLFGLGVENRRLSGTVQLVSVTPKQLEALTDDELAALETAYPVLQKLGIVGRNSGDETEAEE